WLQVRSGIDCGFPQLQATRRVIEPIKVELIVRLSQPAICQKKTRIPRDRLIEQLYRLEIILPLFFTFFIRGLVDPRRRADMKVVVRKVAGWLVLEVNLFASLNFCSKSIY